MSYRPSRLRRLAVLAALPVLVSIAAAPVQAAEPRDLLPNLKMAKPYDLTVATTATGKKWLRFGTIAWNIGEGPLELLGVRDPSAPTMTVTQHIYNDQGGHRDEPSTAEMFYAGDGHDHWHVREFMIIELSRADSADPLRRIRKLGYCLLDARSMTNPPPGSPTTPVYPRAACGFAENTSVTMGLSVGYGDDYPPFFAHQWVNVTGLARGIYHLCATVDPHRQIVESNEMDQSYRMELWINPERSVVRVRATSREPCGPFALA